MGDSPHVMLEIIARQALHDYSALSTELEEADRLLFLPDHPDPMSLHDKGLDVILTDFLTQAVARGELPEGTQVPVVMLGAPKKTDAAPLLPCWASSP